MNGKKSRRRFLAAMAAAAAAGVSGCGSNGSSTPTAADVDETPTAEPSPEPEPTPTPGSTPTPSPMDGSTPTAESTPESTPEETSTATATATPEAAELSDWPVFMYNDQNWGHHPEATGPHGEVSVVWERDLESNQVNGSPVLANGQLYVGDGRRNTDSGTLYVLDPMTGETNWTVDFPGPVMSGACVADNDLVYAGARGTVVAHRQDGGEVYRWNSQSDGLVTSPTFADGSLFFGLEDSLYRYRARAKAQEWVTETFGRIPSAPVYADGTVYIPSFDSTVYAYNADSGNEMWTVDLGGRVNGLSMRNERLYAASENNRLVQLNTQGNQVWEIGTGAAATATPAVTEDSVYVGTRDGALLSRSLDDGFEQWRFTDPSGEITAPPVVADGTVYFGCNDNNVYAISADNGELEWSFETGNNIVNPAPVVSGGMVFIGSRDGKFYALSD